MTYCDTEENIGMREAIHIGNHYFDPVDMELERELSDRGLIFAEGLWPTTKDLTELQNVITNAYEKMENIAESLSP